MSLTIDKFPMVDLRVSCYNYDVRTGISWVPIDTRVYSRLENHDFVLGLVMGWQSRFE